MNYLLRDRGAPPTNGAPLSNGIRSVPIPYLLPTFVAARDISKNSKHLNLELVGRMGHAQNNYSYR